MIGRFINKFMDIYMSFIVVLTKVYFNYPKTFKVISFILMFLLTQIYVKFLK